MKSFLKPPVELRNGYKDPKRLEAVRSLDCCICTKLGLLQLSATEAHHRIGNGIGLKASDLLTFGLCSKHHARGNRGDAIHETPIEEWETKYKVTQDELIALTDELLSKL
jgi:hypothetical protein